MADFRDKLDTLRQLGMSVVEAGGSVLVPPKFASSGGTPPRSDAQKMRNLLSDKDFNRLSLENQISYFGKTFPEFEGMTPGEYQLVRNRAGEDPLIKSGEEFAAMNIAGDVGAAGLGLAGKALSPMMGAAKGIASDVLHETPIIGKTLKRREEALAKNTPREFGKTEKYAESKYAKPPSPTTKAPPLRPNIPEKELPRRMSPAPPLRPNIPTRQVEEEAGEETEKVLTKPKVSPQTAKESYTRSYAPKTSQLSAPKTSSAPKPDDLETQLKKSLESPKAKPPTPKEGEKLDYTKTDKYAKDKTAKNETVVSYLKGKGISKQAWREASLDQKNKWIRDAIGSKHREYQEGTPKAEFRTKEIEDLLPDIDAQQRYGTSETPEVKKFLGH